MTGDSHPPVRQAKGWVRTVLEVPVEVGSISATLSAIRDRGPIRTTTGYNGTDGNNRT